MRRVKPPVRLQGLGNCQDGCPAALVRRPGSHGPSPLSASTQRRLLKALLERADAGDVQAAESLIRLGRDRRTDQPDA